MATATANSIIDQIPKIATGILLLGLFAGASYSSAYWKSFGLNPYHYAELSYIAASAFNGVVYLGLLLIQISIIFFIGYKFGFSTTWKNITQSKIKLEQWKRDIESTQEKINEYSQTKIPQDEGQKDIEALQLEMATVSEAEKTLRKRHDELQDKVCANLKRIRRGLWLMIIYMVAAIMIFRVIAFIEPSFNHLHFEAGIIVAIGLLICLLTLFSATQSTSLSQRYIPEAMLSGIAIFFIWLSMDIAGQGSANQITGISANKPVYTDSANKQYYYLGTLGEYIMLYDPCEEKTTAKLKKSEPTFTIKSAATISIC